MVFETVGFPKILDALYGITLGIPRCKQCKSFSLFYVYKSLSVIL